MEWYQISNESAVPSPAMLLFPDRIRENIRRMVAIAGSPERLRPHVKTHKLPQIVRMQLEAGIRRFKCATLSEAKMVAETGAADILMAYPLYGPAVEQLFRLIAQYPGIQFSAIVDNPRHCGWLEAAAQSHGHPLDVFLDLDVGMERTGFKPGEQALELYRAMARSPWLRPQGLHLYDGHLHIPSRTEREKACDACFAPVKQMIQVLEAEGLAPGEVICGGSPTFPIHAQHPERTLSPGTTLLWDARYAAQFQDMDFLHAAVAFTRVVSKPGKDKLCLDLGHKAIASEMQPPRAAFFGISEYELAVHSEEHKVIAFEGAHRYAVGDCLYAIPTHICPTMALHGRVWAVEGNRAGEQWPVVARERAVDLN
ncbi:MAG: D-TA family PLP-dependent enzyme [Lewinellaceae bacterium]|nr:D-TA family PLP-dependent enzyme [Phaeodactylibacter sp.]MCB9036661.1 D-TA family PLP-dependent enzyme [Lewinellaceae bacterium]